MNEVNELVINRVKPKSKNPDDVCWAAELSVKLAGSFVLRFSQLISNAIVPTNTTKIRISNSGPEPDDSPGGGAATASANAGTTTTSIQVARMNRMEKNTTK